MTAFSTKPMYCSIRASGRRQYRQRLHLDNGSVGCRHQKLCYSCTTGNIAVTDSAGAQNITGTAARDNISAGAGGGDTVTVSVVVEDIDTLYGGDGTGDILVLTGGAAGAIVVDLSSATEQFADVLTL